MKADSVSFCVCKHGDEAIFANVHFGHDDGAVGGFYTADNGR